MLEGPRYVAGSCVFIIMVMSNLEMTTTTRQERTSALYRGDFIIGALYSIHHQPQKKSGTTPHFLECGDIREIYGIQRTEVTFQTLDKINKDPDLLPNITLGAEIRDSCWYAPVALQQTIELIRDSITPVTHPTTTCPTDEVTEEESPGTNSPRVPPPRGTLIGVVGPGSSSVAMQVQNLLQLFGIPQVAYSATSRDLSDKSRFSTFLRVVPSDYYQAQVLVDIVREHNWTYVSAVNTDENYGQSGIQAFRELAERANVCIAKEDSVLSNAAEEDFDEVVKNLRTDKNAKVVVCFCEGMTIRGLLKAERRLNVTDKLLIIGSDGWADRSDVVEGYQREAQGSISIRIHSPNVKNFDDYYFGLKPSTNDRNPWFNEFWQSKFSCKMPDVNDESSGIKSDIYNQSCTGDEGLRMKYKQDSKMSFVIKALYTMAHGLHDMAKALCGTRGSCPALFPFNGTLFKSYLMNVSFTTEDGELVEFDKHGDPPGRYEIMNYQLLENGTFDYVHIGDWNGGEIRLFNTTNIQYGTQTKPPTSVCSRPCDPGYYKNFQTGGQEKRCCWACVPCDKHEMLFNETTCLPCRLGWYPNDNKTECLEATEEHVRWSDSQAIVAITFSCIGFIATALTAVVFIRHNNTPVVKSSTRELSYLILAGMTLSHAATFPILAKPAPLTCALSRTMPGISFAMIYASLLTKTNRIARILAGSKKRFPTRKPRLMSGTAQVVMSGLLVGVEVAVAVSMLILEPARADHVYPSRSRSQLVCDTSARGVLAPLAFDFLLVALCTLYAVKTRNVPENFNEAKFIGFAMYTTCVIWVAFVPIYFGSESKIITMCMCVTLSAMVTLIFLFLPKLYIILFRPERNNRALFTTSKSIRCHIGSRVASAISDKSCSSFSNTGTNRGTDKATITQQHNVNWKDDMNDSKRSSKLEQRTLSCQTDNELLECLLQSHKNNVQICPALDTDWAELNPKALMDSQNLKNCGNGGRKLSPSTANKSSNPTLLKTKHTMTPRLHPKARIREESVSECSLSDEDMTQIKSITITLGSTNSVNNNLNAGRESDLQSSLFTDVMYLRKTTSESPLSYKRNVTSNGISNSTV
ncbi:metabotropic glutamate receptor 5-like isoform X2 [Arctopsyche grandis]|uniref:metabotropic glutamate receptor 5-like isoform X2 n=1 Tax=Arctopsyche grandis TaxID=121162 RepID=UPI00406D8899